MYINRERDTLLYTYVYILFCFLAGAASMKYCRQGLKQTDQDSIQTAGRSATQKLAQPANYETNKQSPRVGSLAAQSGASERASKVKRADQREDAKTNKNKK